MPTGNFPVDGCEWGFLLDSGGVAPEVIKLSYQLFKGDGTAVTEARSVDYSESGFYVHFGKIIANYLTTNFPTDPFEDVSGMAEEFYVRYGEIHINTETGAVTEVGFENTELVRAINATYQIHHDEYPREDLNPQFQTVKRSPIYLCRDQQDYLFVATTLSAAELHVSAYDAEDNQVIVGNPLETLYAGKVYAVSIGLDNAIYAYSATELGTVVRAVFEFKQDAVTVATWEVHYGGCSGKPFVMFQEPAGGFSSLCFDDIQFGAVRQVDTFSQFSPDLAGDLTTKKNGLHATNGKSFVKVTLKKKFARSIPQTEQEFLESFIASQAHFLKYVVPGFVTQNTFVKIIVDNSEFKTRGEGVTEWTVTARFHKDLKALQSRI